MRVLLLGFFLMTWNFNAFAVDLWACHFSVEIPTIANELQCRGGSMTSLDNGATCCLANGDKLAKFNITPEQLYYGSQWWGCSVDGEFRNSDGDSYSRNLFSKDLDAEGCLRVCQDHSDAKELVNLRCVLEEGNDKYVFFEGKPENLDLTKFGTGTARKYGAMREFGKWLGYR